VNGVNLYEALGTSTVLSIISQMRMRYKND
jgi:hypothetical protein